MKKKSKVIKDIRATIRLLRFLTKGEGYAEIHLFDAGAGGGFADGSVSISLERSGLTFNVDSKSPKLAHTPEELEQMIIPLLSTTGQSMEEINAYYKKCRWNN